MMRFSLLVTCILSIGFCATAPAYAKDKEFKLRDYKAKGVKSVKFRFVDPASGAIIEEPLVTAKASKKMIDSGLATAETETALLPNSIGKQCLVDLVIETKSETIVRPQVDICTLDELILE
jgi:hypothetical protein